MPEDLVKDVNQLKHAVFGDQANLAGWPGLVSERNRMDIQQETTNKILGDVLDSVRWIIRLLISGFVTAALSGAVALIYKGLQH